MHRAVVHRSVLDAHVSADRNVQHVCGIVGRIPAGARVVESVEVCGAPGTSTAYIRPTSSEFSASHFDVLPKNSVYIGRGDRHHEPSRWANHYKVRDSPRRECIAIFRELVPSLPGFPLCLWSSLASHSSATAAPIRSAMPTRSSKRATPWVSPGVP